MTTIHKNMGPSKILVRDLNPFITCPLCRGYFVDATALVDCLHVFCRACILRYFENFKLACPTCNMVYKKKNNPCFRSDTAIQSLVYKMVPGLYSKEVQRREDFYRSTGVRAGSSCSEDSVLGDLGDEHEEWVLSTSDQNQYFSPDEVISLSLEYYKPYLDTTNSTNNETKSTNLQLVSDNDQVTQKCDSASDDKVNTETSDNNSEDADAKKEKSDGGEDISKRDPDRRYLRCPAAVTMSHLQKFLRMKYALSVEHRVDIIYLGEVLPAHFSLMDVAYTFKWKRTNPMRFFFRIFTPAKIQPIKIINTSSMGGKQLQVVMSKNNALPPSLPLVETKLDTLKDDSGTATEISDDQKLRKERLMANLQLQSKIKTTAEPNGKCSAKDESSTTATTTPCIYEYEEPDKDEIRAFAEKRDREWALQKQLDEEKEKHRNGKKRKKSKHSRSNLLYKKRKLHAEITSNDSLQKEESLKLKVKIMPHNGYKHKHHKSSQNHSSSFESPPKTELSSKEKLLQMRQVRHKHISSEEKTKNHSKEENSDDEKKERKEASITQVPKPTESVESLKVTFKSTENSDKPKEIKILTNHEVKKCPTVQLERHEQAERQAQKSFLKTFQSYTENYSQARENSISSSNNFNTSNKTRLTYPARNLSTTRALEQKIQSLQKHCTTVEPKPVSKLSLKLNKKPEGAEKPNNVYSSSSGFTVSKVEVGVKRKLEDDQNLQEKFPSLEITLINPPSNEKPSVSPPAAVAKVPPTTISKVVPTSTTRVIPPLNAKTTTSGGTNPISNSLPNTRANPLPNVRTTVLPNTRTTASPNTRTTPSPNTRTTPSPNIRATPSPNTRSTPSPNIRTTTPSPSIRTTASSTVARPAPSPTMVTRPSSSPTIKTTSLASKAIPPVTIGKPNVPEVKHVAKRPPPATIPLDKIKKSMNRSASAVVSKQSQCDNSGALDLTKPNKIAEVTPENHVSSNGTGFTAPKVPEKGSAPGVQLSNLHMLSKVATELPNINKSPPPTSNGAPNNNVKRTQMPSLQMLKVPSLQGTTQKPNLAKLPKLTEINKHQFRLPNPQLKNMRPNQNQSIRNIPNPSLVLMRQQNQNRPNSTTPGNGENSEASPKTTDAVQIKAESGGGERAQENKQNKIQG